jgi:hypothetical protein
MYDELNALLTALLAAMRGGKKREIATVKRAAFTHIKERALFPPLPKGKRAEGIGGN